jgi:hypothetical protein
MPDTSSFNLFVSYSRRDNLQNRVSDFVDRIREDYRAATDGTELRLFFDSDNIKGMDDWRHRILGAIRSTRLLLVCLSPHFVESDYCAWEVTEDLKHETTGPVLGDGIAPIYFVEIPAWGSKDLEKHPADCIKKKADSPCSKSQMTSGCFSIRALLGQN